MATVEDLLLKLDKWFEKGEISKNVYVELKVMFDTNTNLKTKPKEDNSNNVNKPTTTPNINKVEIKENKSDHKQNTIGACPICKNIIEDNYFHCYGCNNDFICLTHFDKKIFFCLACTKNNNNIKVKKTKRFFIEAERFWNETEYLKARKLFEQVLELNPIHQGAIDFLKKELPMKVNEQDNSRMILIPASEFQMGAKKDDPNCDEDEKPIHVVELDAFYISKSPITVKQYMTFCEKTGLRMPREPIWGWLEKHPMVNVTWEDAVEYCEWAGGRLPTEAEWEKAARGTDGRTYPWGEDIPFNDYANFDKSYGKTSPVGTCCGLSPYGLQDMVGNVFEWCSDWYGEDYYKDTPKKNPEGLPYGSSRVIRGGSWNHRLQFLRTSFRYCVAPNTIDNTVGFRMVIKV